MESSSIQSQKLFCSVSRLWSNLSKRRQLQFYGLVVLMIVASGAEMLSIGLTLPFLAALTSPEEIYRHDLMQPFIELMAIDQPEGLILPLTAAFVIAAFIGGGIRLLLLYAMTRVSFATGADISIDIFKRTLYQDYEVHTSRNSSEVINGVIRKAGIMIGAVLVPVLTIISSMFLMIGIMTTLIVIDTTIAISSFIGFGLLYWSIVKFTKQHINQNSICIANESTQVIKHLQEGLGGIRDVLLDNTQQYYCRVYRKADLSLRHAQGNNFFIAGSPRYVMEPIGMILIALMAYSMTQRSEGLNEIVPVLGALALGAQRLLPALQQSYSAIINIKGEQQSMYDVLDLLEQPLPEVATVSTPLDFKEEIRMERLGFQYDSGSPWVLRNINLTIPKGSRVGFIGTTGSGKSTLLDIIMGLLLPSEGSLAIDDQKITSENRTGWQEHVAHVPQTIYLSDSTIEENIAFGVEKDKIDTERVRRAAQQAQIASSIEEWPDKYQTFVGERGVRLSGGQRQRIGIARALYKEANVIIFDEATSALDYKTESKFMEAVESLGMDLTILIVAHRLTTLSKCNQIVEIGEGKIMRVGKYEEMVH